MIRRSSALGVTLIELLVVVAIVGTLTAALTRAYVVGIDYDARVRAGRAELAVQRTFEDRLRSLLEHAYVSADTSDATTFFIGSAGSPIGGDAGSTSDTLTFTTVGSTLPSVLLTTQDDFERLNERFGAQGGIAEVMLALEPVGQPVGPDGLFFREQRPSDGDPTQGGQESLLMEGVFEILFEFWDGLAWVPSWDTRLQPTRRLPAAVRVTYRMEEDQPERILTIRIPSSDITAENPLTEAAQ